MKDCFGRQPAGLGDQWLNAGCTKCVEFSTCKDATELWLFSQSSTFPPGYPPVTNPMRDDDASLHEAEERIIATRLDSLLKETASTPDAPQQKKALQPALHRQEGGSHYKEMKIQPVEFIHANNIPFIEGCCIKYLVRWRSKGGLEDLKKVRHFVDLLIELESPTQQDK